jgi:biotin operon repressor
VDRAAKIEKARELRAENITCREIAQRVGLTSNVVQAETWDVEIQKECPGCGTDLTGTHGRTKWCSERCRRHTMYSNRCRHCGASVYDGSAQPPDECGECLREERFGERNGRLREMWEADEPTWYIAEKLGMSEIAVTTWVDGRRRKHDEDLPLRRLGGDATERRKRHRRMIKLRRAGLTSAEIADAVGMASADSVNQAFHTMRKKGWDVPAGHRGRRSSQAVAA